MILFEFRDDLWHQKTRVMGLSSSIIILCLAVLIQYQSVMDTDRQTDTRRRHTPRLAWRRAVMKASQGFPLTKPMAVNTGLRNCVACDKRQTDIRVAL